MRKSLLVVALAGALTAGFFGGTVQPGSAQEGPPARTPGCAHFAENATEQITNSPALDAVNRSVTRGGFGPCFAPNAGDVCEEFGALRPRTARRPALIPGHPGSPSP